MDYPEKSQLQPSASEVDKEQPQPSPSTPQPVQDRRDASPSPPASIRRLATNPSHINDNVLSLSEVGPVSVQLDQLSIAVDESSNNLLRAFNKKQKTPLSHNHAKPILNSISATMPSGTLTAIIGGSGSGKTSLLNQMSGRIKGSRLRISGRTLFNGSEDASQIRSAYVIQHDILLPTLTVRETLTYAARLRLPPSIAQAERKQLVEEVILELGLKEAADTKIGNHAHKGCSGGEKRRTSIGVQLLSNPSLLYLDEPTTGLDSTSAYQVIKTLQNLARKGRTIIVTIHAPRSEIWNLVDNVILLTRGNPAYAGPTKDCLPYFAKLGYEMPPFTNPAEHSIDIVSIDNRNEEAEAAAQDRVGNIVEAWRQHSKLVHGEKEEVTGGPTDVHTNSTKTNCTSFIQQTRVLTARTWTVTLRDPMGVFASLSEAIVMAVVTGWIFVQLDGSLAGIRSRQGALYTSAVLQGYLILLYETYRLTADVQLFDEEARQGVVSIPAFLLSRRLARVFIEDVPVPLIFSLIYYFLCGFRPDAGQFFTFFSILLLNHYISLCFAMTCISISRNFAGASLVANLSFTLQSMACGYFVQANTIPIYVRWTKWTAYVYYAFGGLVSNEFAGSFYNCPLQGGPSNPGCKEYTGDFVIKSLGFPNNWVWRPILALLGFAIFFYIVAGVIFKLLRVELGMARARPSNVDASAGKEKMNESGPGDVRSISIRLEEYGLNIEKRSLRHEETKSILKPITADFRPGSLNVIMGPSGSGKTSLLNSLAGRLKDDTSTRYKRCGTMKYNGLQPSAEVVHSICSFVTQDDDALLASLTVRETLRYAAGLRLPKWMSKEQKNQRAEEILLKMGLKDCADNLIGNDLIKGISGGEKRRTSIAIETLTEPRILLLDEPLSGLDAFTSLSIMDVLRGLVNEGRTLIVTIHQPRSDLFSHFGNILLLARGGHPVYAGPGQDMLLHFSSQGYKCPQHVNPADFALDLITVDLQHEQKEAASRAKVRRLIESWSSDMFRLAQTNSIMTPAELGSLAREPASFTTAYPILMRRTMKNLLRQPDLIIARIMQVVGLGLVLALYFAPLNSDYFSIQNRLGFLIEVAPLYFVGMLNNIAVYPTERDVFYRDYDDRVYGVEAFFLTYISITTPFEIISCLLFAILGVLAVGLERNAKTFFIFAFNAFCVTSCGESIGIIFNTFFTHTGFSVNIMSVLLSLAQIMGGIMSISTPAFLDAWNHLSPIKWSVANLVPYAFRGMKFTCQDWQKIDGQCPITTGEQVLDLYKLNKNPNMSLMALGICAIVYRFLGYVVLKAAKERWIGRLWKKISKDKKKKKKHATPTTELTAVVAQ